MLAKFESDKTLLKRLGVPEAVITQSGIKPEHYAGIYTKLFNEGAAWVASTITAPWQLIALSGQADLFTVELIAEADRDGIEFVEYAAWSGNPEALKKINELSPGVFYRDNWQLVNENKSRPDMLLHYAAASGRDEQLDCALKLRVAMHSAPEKGQGWLQPITMMSFNSRLKNSQLPAINAELNNNIYFIPEFVIAPTDIDTKEFNKTKNSLLRNQEMRRVMGGFIPRLELWYKSPSDTEKAAILSSFTSAAIATVPGVSTDAHAQQLFDQMLDNKAQQPLRQIIDTIDNEIKRRLAGKVLSGENAQYRYSQRLAFTKTTLQKLDVLYALKAIVVEPGQTPQQLRTSVEEWEIDNRASIDDKKITIFNKISQTRIAVNAIEEILTRWEGPSAGVKVLQT